MLNKKQIIKNQILTDIKIWLDDFGTTYNEGIIPNTLEGAAVGIMAKVKNYLTMGDENE